MDGSLRRGQGGGGRLQRQQRRLWACAAQKKCMKMHHQLPDRVAQLTVYSLWWMKFCCKLETWKCRSSRISQVILMEILNRVILGLVRTEKQGNPFGEEKEFLSFLVLV